MGKWLLTQIWCVGDKCLKVGRANCVQALHLLSKAAASVLTDQRLIWT